MATAREPKLSKRIKALRSKVDREKFYPVEDALKLVKETAVAKFDESVAPNRPGPRPARSQHHGVLQGV